jgi:sugar (pentulose or hexulose) kinase
VLAEDIETSWGKVTLVTGSHDQYAAMEAAGLLQDTTVMLGTGTAWVINGRTSKPLFDDERFLAHPGRDLYRDCYGLIVTLWQIGAGLEQLLARLGMTPASLAKIEAAFARVGPPSGPVRVDLETATVEPEGDAATCVRRYMEWAASAVAHALGTCGLKQGLERIVATGGAMASRFWPQAIADVCGLPVDAVECSQFTAYGAALHARQALRGSAGAHYFPDTAIVRTYTPQRSQEYQAWYHTFQRPMLELQSESASRG